MSLIIFYTLAVLCFMAGFVITHIVKTTKETMTTVHQAMTVISSKELSDLEKEKTVQKAAINMFKHFGLIVIKFAIIGAMSMLPVVAGNLLSVYSYEEFTAFTLRWDVLTITTIAAIAVVYLVRFIRKKA